jgi:hypothetical protein
MENHTVWLTKPSNGRTKERRHAEHCSCHGMFIMVVDTYSSLFKIFFDTYCARPFIGEEPCSGSSTTASFFMVGSSTKHHRPSEDR